VASSFIVVVIETVSFLISHSLMVFEGFLVLCAVAARGTDRQHGKPQLLLLALPANGDTAGLRSPRHIL
jgi:hypothetical protein